MALQAMLRKAGVANVSRLQAGEEPAPGDLVLRPADAAGGRWPLLLFKALQLMHVRSLGSQLTDYVAFDLETTDLDVAACEIVELAAVRVRSGKAVAEFRELVRCVRPVSAKARAIHGYGDDDLRYAPSFAEAWPRFCGVCRRGPPRRAQRPAVRCARAAPVGIRVRRRR